MATQMWRCAAASLTVGLLTVGVARAETPWAGDTQLTGGAAAMTLGLNPGDEADTHEVWGYRGYYPRYSYGYRYSYGFPRYSYGYRYSYGFPRYSYGYRYSYGFPRYSYGYRYSYGFPRYSYGFYGGRYFGIDGTEAQVGTLTLGLYDNCTLPVMQLNPSNPYVAPQPQQPQQPQQGGSNMPYLPPTQDPQPRSSEPESDQPSYPYDGGPSQPVPMPKPSPAPSATPDDGGTLRISMPATPKYRFKAYGEK